ncbi:MAG: universal stress protein [Bauldia sp.]|nr:universal stress protein [Bauldia sp.]
MRRIAVATDFSERGSIAIERAVAISEVTGAELLYLHAVDDDRPVHMVAAATEQAREQLLQERQAHGDRVRSLQEIALGDTHRAILTAVTHAGAELLVVGDHRRSAIRDMFRDTTVERLARLVQIPLLLARLPATRPYSRALVGLESDEANELVGALELLGKAAPSSLTGLHAFNATGAGMLGSASVPEASIDAYRADVMNSTRSRLVASFAPAVRSRLRLRLEDADPAPALMKAAEEENCELTVVSTHARRGIMRAILGSVSADLIRRGTTDLLVVPRTPG